jgi:hypothetical protein
MTDSTLDIERLVKVFIKLRNKRSELKKAFEDQDAELEEKQTIIKQALMDYCKEHNVESGRTDAGSFYRKTSTRYETNDWDSMYGFIKEHDALGLLDRRINQSNMKEFLTDHPDLLPPGLNSTVKYEIVITKPRASGG